jgi:serine/threonine protein kinase
VKSNWQLSLLAERPEQGSLKSALLQFIILYGVARTLTFLHSHQIAHETLQPANILLGEALHPVVCDFGQKATTDGPYRAPELARGGAPTPGSDVYAFGVLAGYDGFMSFCERSRPIELFSAITSDCQVMLGLRKTGSTRRICEFKWTTSGRRAALSFV